MALTCPLLQRITPPPFLTGVSPEDTPLINLSCTNLHLRKLTSSIQCESSVDRGVCQALLSHNAGQRHVQPQRVGATPKGTSETLPTSSCCREKVSHLHTWHLGSLGKKRPQDPPSSLPPAFSMSPWKPVPAPGTKAQCQAVRGTKPASLPSPWVLAPLHASPTSPAGPPEKHHCPEASTPLPACHPGPLEH